MPSQQRVASSELVRSLDEGFPPGLLFPKSGPLAAGPPGWYIWRVGSRARLHLELRQTLKLSLPIVFGQVGQMSMGLVDTAVAGRISLEALAGLGLATTVFWGTFHMFMSILFALDTHLSQAVGEREFAKVGRFFRHGLALSILLSIACAGVTLGIMEAYLRWGRGGADVRLFAQYTRIAVLGLPAGFLFVVLQRYWQARQHTVAFAVILIGGNVANLAGNLAFGLGMWGFPRMESAGLAWSTTWNRWLMLAIAAGLTAWWLRRERLEEPSAPAASLNAAALAAWGREFSATAKSILRLGVPAGLQAALEVGSFIILMLTASQIGPVELASCQVCLMLASFSFMFPLGFSAAAAVRVGTFIGAGDPAAARLAGWMNIGLAAGAMLGFGLLYLAIPETLVGLLSKDTQVVALGSKVLLVVALFQLGDGVQVSATGALRGLGDTRSPMVANLIGHYPIGLATGLLLTFAAGMGLVGLWLGLALGLSVVAGIVLARWRQTSRRLTI
jgi:MATE family multidrug resistance protein